MLSRFVLSFEMRMVGLFFSDVDVVEVCVVHASFSVHFQIWMLLMFALLTAVSCLCVLFAMGPPPRKRIRAADKPAAAALEDGSKLLMHGGHGGHLQSLIKFWLIERQFWKVCKTVGEFLVSKWQ